MVYVYNPGKAPQIYGGINLAPESYAVISEQEAVLLRNGQLPVAIEGDPEFQPFWVTYPRQ